MAIDIFNEALGIDGGEPITINVGADVELTIRTSHTGLQAAEWMKAENKRVDATEKILMDKELSDTEQIKQLQRVSKAYAVDLIKSVTVDADTKTVNAAATAICELPTNARTAVFRKLGALAGVVDEDGNTFLSKEFSNNKISVS